MDMLQKQFLECSDPERVKERFMPSIVRLKMQGTRMKDRAFDATENSVCGFSTVSKVPAVFPLKTRITPYERSASKPFRKSISGI